MRKTPLCLCLLFMLGASAAGSQPSVSFFVKGMYNFAAMGDLKEIQQRTLSELTAMMIPAEITEGFRPYVGVQGGITFPVGSSDSPSTFIGAVFDYASTGGRVHYQDYSGELRNDQVAVAYSGGGVLVRRYRLSLPLDLEASLSARLVYSTFRETFFSRIGSTSRTDEAKFTSWSVGIEPCLMPTYHLAPLTLGLSVSYFIYLPSELKYDGSVESYLMIAPGEKATINWSGLRFGALVSIDI